MGLRLMITSCFSLKHMEQNLIIALPWIWVLIIYETKDTFQELRTVEWDVYWKQTEVSEFYRLLSNFYLIRTIFCPEVLSFKIPCSGICCPQCLAFETRNQQTSRVDGLSFVCSVSPPNSIKWFSPVCLFCVSFGVKSQQASFGLASRSGVHTRNIFSPQSGLFLYMISQFGWVPICRGEVLLDSTLNLFIGNQCLWGKSTLIGIGSFVA